MFPQLATRRFLLQQIVTDDQAFIFEGLSHPEVIPFYGVRYHTFEGTGIQMDYYQNLWQKELGAWWKIVDAENFEKLGAIGFNNHNKLHHKCELGYWLLPQHWGKGIISEAMKELTAYLFETHGVHRIEALIETENERSIKAAQRCGFQHEGTLRDYEKKEDRFISLYVYSLLATDKKNHAMHM